MHLRVSPNHEVLRLPKDLVHACDELTFWTAVPMIVFFPRRCLSPHNIMEAFRPILLKSGFSRSFHCSHPRTRVGTLRHGLPILVSSHCLAHIFVCLSFFLSPSPQNPHSLLAFNVCLLLVFPVSARKSDTPQPRNFCRFLDLISE